MAPAAPGSPASTPAWPRRRDIHRHPAVGTYGPALGNIPTDQLSRVQTNYATVELTDGANLAGMQTLGQMRANAPQVEQSITNLENDSLSSDPDLNTEIAVLNKINAAGVVGLRNTQDTNKLLATLTEEQIIEAKRQRDAEAQAFNDHIQFMSQGQAAMAAVGRGEPSHAGLAHALGHKGDPMPPSLTNDLFSFLTQLMTQNASLFQTMGTNMFRGFAVILIVWFGVKSALGSAGGGTGPLFHFDNFRTC